MEIAVTLTIELFGSRRHAGHRMTRQPVPISLGRGVRAGRYPIVRTVDNRATLAAYRRRAGRKADGTVRRKPSVSPD